jgi:hypothetical protein
MTDDLAPVLIERSEARACPVCHMPLGADEVYRAGYEMTNNRTIPPTIGRGQYCDHIKRVDLTG